jgi:rRNA-processing protein EBP2
MSLLRKRAHPQISQNNNKNKYSKYNENDESSDDALEFSDDDIDLDPAELQAVAEHLQKQMQSQMKQKKKPQQMEDDDDEMDDDDDDDDDDSDDGDEPQTKRVRVEKEEKVYINNEMGLVAKLREIATPLSLPWIEVPSVVALKATEVSNPNDDLIREREFYARTVEGVTIALTHLNGQDVPFIRPMDYYAEMVKPDTHMAKVKASLLTEQARISAVEKRKKDQLNRKLSKAVHTDRVKEKVDNKKAHMAEVESLRAQSGSRGERSTLPGAEDIRAHTKKQQTEKYERKNRKRDAKNEKYGFGGKKKHIKSNDKSSASDMSSFSARKNRTPFPGMDGPSRGRGGSRGSSRGGSRGGFGGSRGGSRGGRGGSRGGHGGGRGGRGRR